jgi:hypothetical protein
LVSIILLLFVEAEAAYAIEERGKTVTRTMTTMLIVMRVSHTRVPTRWMMTKISKITG